MPPDDSAYRILFVCTGNIFRSLTADVALQKALAGNSGIELAALERDSLEVEHGFPANQAVNRRHSAHHHRLGQISFGERTVGIGR